MIAVVGGPALQIKGNRKRSSFVTNQHFPGSKGLQSRSVNNYFFLDERIKGRVGKFSCQISIYSLASSVDSFQVSKTIVVIGMNVESDFVNVGVVVVVVDDIGRQGK